MNDKSIQKIQKLKKRRKRVRVLYFILALFLVFVILFGLFKIVSLFQKSAEIVLSAQNLEILQGEEMPKLQAKVRMSEDSDLDAVLDKKEKYTAADLIKDLESGKGYTLTCKADPKVEGAYQIKVVLKEEFSQNVDKKWKHLKFSTKNGYFKVKNPVGFWDGDKFKKYDNSYVKNDFVESKTNLYYFGKDGVKVTGWKKINGETYYFNKEGVMQKNTWKNHKKDKYYLGESGAAVTGWKTIKKKTYYFDISGKMATGEVSIGLSKCTFNKKGELIAKKESEIDPSKPMVALTFDDGPGKRTGELLAQLEKYSAHATFFMLGQHTSSYKEEIKKMKEIGCELGNHSYDHKDLSRLSAGGVKSEIEDTNNKLKQIVGSEATVMRPPYGAISDTVKKNVGMPMILWNIDTLDWKTRNAKKTINTVMDNVGDGDIILLHDIHSESVDAALKLIPKLQKAGYQLVTVSEMAAAKGKTLEKGGRYTDFTK